MTEHIIISNIQNNQCIQNSHSACHGMPKVPLCMPDIMKRDKISHNFVLLGLVVQSIVSLTSSLSSQLVKYFTTSYPNTLILFVEKMREAYAFSTKNSGVYQVLRFEILT